MTISLVTLESFKCFTALDLPCAPLTLLTGQNAGGKSTALQALLLLTQGLREGPNSGVLPLNGPLVELGTASDVIQHSMSPPVLSLGAGSSTERALWRFEVDRDLSTRGLMRLAKVSYVSRGDSLDLESPRLLPPAMADSDLVDSLRHTTFISAGREVQVDAYPVPRRSAQIAGDVGCSGEYAPYWYLESADEEVSTLRRHPTDNRETVRAQVDAWLHELFPGARVSAERLAPDAPVRLSFSVGKTSPWSKPANVGYGLSYAFPMLVSLLVAPPGSVVVIDSAEAHLHPRAQSAVGHLLGRMAGAGLQLLVESHSDHLLNGVRLAVRHGLVQPGDVAVHFFGHRSGANPVMTVTVDRDGAISDWPEGFFDQTERDLAALSGWA